MIWLGIDPGAQGGLVAITNYQDDANGVRDFCPMPKDMLGVWRWFCQFIDYHAVTTAYIEQVGGFVGERSSSEKKGGGSANGSAMFAFGKSYGSLLMALTASGIAFKEVPPRVWQRGVGIAPRKKSETRTQWKNRLRDHAQLLFPRLKVTLSVADALLIAAYCKSEES
jgi:hypothetical protein